MITFLLETLGGVLVPSLRDFHDDVEFPLTTLKGGLDSGPPATWSPVHESAHSPGTLAPRYLSRRLLVLSVKVCTCRCGVLVGLTYLM